MDNINNNNNNQIKIFDDIIYNDNNNEEPQVVLEQEKKNTNNIIIGCIQKYIWPGMGLFGESYLLFSIGILRPIWELLYPNCFLYNKCTATLLHSISYSVIIGVMIGMISLGVLSDKIGRRYGSIITATFMSLSSIGMVCITFMYGNTNNDNNDDSNILFTCMSILLFLFGIGVGGEYPLSASSASEQAMIDNNTNTTKNNNKGKSVILVFAMQGMGIFCNSSSLTILLYTFNEMGNYNAQNKNAVYDSTNKISGVYNSISLLIIWRTVYSIGAFVLFIVLLSRICFLEESIVWKEDYDSKYHNYKKSTNKHLSSEKENDHEKTFPTSSPKSNTSALCYLEKINNNETHDDDNDQYVLYSDPTLSALTEDNVDYSIIRNYHEHQLHSKNNNNNCKFISIKNKLLLSNYGMRLLGTCTSWLLWDIAFYGNKLFQSSFLLILVNNNEEEENITLFIISLAITLNSIIALLGYYVAAFIIDYDCVGRLRLQFYGFLITGTLFLSCGYMPKDSISSNILIFIYFGSSFFGQCGPNVTTFLIPAEIFPTEKRSMCHGLSAASGKLGALIAAILFNYVSDSRLFLISGYCCFASSIITLITIPETNNLDLLEMDKKWRWIVNDGSDCDDDDSSHNYHKEASYGRRRYYCGPANDDQFLSFYEQLRKVYYKRYNR